jgi:glyoxylase-like metal-dependent hydrolase (beta-lactamase superfamily II)
MVAIGRMMMSDPGVMLLDEPSLGLAPLVIEAIGKALRQLRDQGRSLLLVEQRVDLALAVCDRLYVMSGGMVVRENRCADVDPAGRALIDAYLGLLVSENYEVLAVLYGTRQTSASEVFLGYAGYGEPDRPLGMDYFFWIARNQARTVVIDTGFSPAGGAVRRRTTLMDQATALREAGVAADTVPQVIITHAHYDHIGGLPAFGAAEVIMTRSEYDFWSGPMGARPLFAHSAEASEISHLRSLRAAGRLTLTGREHQVAPGIELTEVGGHTPGQAIVTVRTDSGQVVLASDAVHYYEELERDRPFSTVANLVGMYAAFDQIREMAQDAGVSVVAGHDPAVTERFPAFGGRKGVILLSSSPGRCGPGKQNNETEGR